ncbi:MAG TPA: GTP-binding protein [Devosia sp.]|jgi:G3E family GTPase|uniref:CobW family GTP-binding protein n=1 Tax=Devosia sp. TaxID=1871048 RepID=UPI002DDD14E5|nr:GTP-binding protein [Devosia sp.]HEV2516101.1 GTP-binding protein [Devosia sp.]
MSDPEPGLAEPIPVFLLTGFLGSGKTTLLNRMIAPGAPRTAVIVNEFGDVPIDNDLVQVDGEDMTFAETSTGCICCEPGNDIVSTLARLSDGIDEGKTGRIERVVIETTGLADPAPIINQMLLASPYRIGGRYFSLASVITTLDAVRGAATVEERILGHKQLAFADRIALTKSDLLAHEQAERRHALDQLIARINPGAHVVDVQAPLAQPETLLSAGSYGASGRSSDVVAWLAAESPISRAFAKPAISPVAGLGRHSGIYTKSMVMEEPVSARELVTFIDVLRRAAGSRLLRLKGLVALDDDPERPMLVHLVQDIFHPPVRLERWPSEDRRTRLVLIADGIDEAALDSFFDTLKSRRRRAPA